jgi:hypothetical protein
MAPSSHAQRKTEAIGLTKATTPASWQDLFCRMLARNMRHLLCALYYVSPTFDIRIAGELAQWSLEPTSYPAEQNGRIVADIELGQFPPRRHPETLVTSAPLSPCEQELWMDALGEL